MTNKVVREKKQGDTNNIIREIKMIIYEALLLFVGLSILSLQASCIFHVSDLNTPTTLVLETGANQINMPSHIERYEGYARAADITKYIGVVFMYLFVIGSIASLLFLTFIYHRSRKIASDIPEGFDEYVDVNTPIISGIREYLIAIIPIIASIIVFLPMLNGVLSHMPK